MIIDRLERLAQYAALHPNMAVAVDFLRTHDLSQLPDGRTDVDGENVFINISTNTLDSDKLNWEAHKLYADIQVLLEGFELFRWGTLAELLPSPNQSDYYPCRAGDDVMFGLTAGQFVMFFPLEPHAPGNFTIKGEKNRKAVIKVRM